MAKKKEQGADSVLTLAGELQQAVKTISGMSRQRPIGSLHRDILFWVQGDELWASGHCGWGYVACRVAKVSTRIPTIAINAAYIAKCLSAFERTEPVTLTVGDTITLTVGHRRLSIPRQSADAESYGRPPRGNVVRHTAIDPQLFRAVVERLTPIAVAAVKNSSGRPKLEFLWSWSTAQGGDAWLASDGSRVICVAPKDSALLPAHTPIDQGGAYGLSYEVATTLCRLLESGAPSAPVSVQLEKRRAHFDCEEFQLSAVIENEPMTIERAIPGTRAQMQKACSFTCTDEFLRSAKICAKMATDDTQTCSLVTAHGGVRLMTEASTLVSFDSLVELETTGVSQINLGARFMSDMLDGAVSGESTVEFSTDAAIHVSTLGLHQVTSLCLGRR